MKLPLSKDTMDVVQESHLVGDSWHETISVFTMHALDEILDYGRTMNPAADQFESFELKVTTVYDHGGYFMDTISAKAKLDQISDEIEVECKLND